MIEFGSSYDVNKANEVVINVMFWNKEEGMQFSNHIECKFDKISEAWHVKPVIKYQVDVSNEEIWKVVKTRYGWKLPNRIELFDAIMNM